MNIAVSKHGIDVARQEVVPEFVRDAEVLESDVVDVGRVGDSEPVAGAQEHAGDTLGVSEFRPDLDTEGSGESDGVHWERGNIVLLNDFLRRE